MTKFEILLSLTLSSKWQNSAPGIRALDKIPLRMLKVNVFLSVMIFCTFELTKPSRSISDTLDEDLNTSYGSLQSFYPEFFKLEFWILEIRVVLEIPGAYDLGPNM